MRRIHGGHGAAGQGTIVEECLPNRNVSSQSEGLRGRAYHSSETLPRTLSATSAGVVGQQGVNLPERDLSMEDMGQRGREQMEVDATKREPDPLVKGGDYESRFPMWHGRLGTV